MWNRKVFVRIIEVLFCIACVVALRVTDDESRRIFHYLRSRSREWSSLLNNVTWGAIGAALATATCGGYIIITAGLLVAAATNELKGRKTETFLLGLGVILFGIVGGLSFASIESVPQDLIDNAAVLGALCLATALLFIVDLLIGQPPSDEKKQATQILPKGKDAAKRTIGATSLTSEKESKVATGMNGGGGGGGDGGSEKVREVIEDPPRFSSEPEESSRIVEQAREPSEYTENLENGRTVLRAAADPTTRNVYQRPVDELDTPPFPLHLERNLINPAVKIMRVDRDVQENIDNNRFNRYSDTSQYDNVPSRLTVGAASPGIRKKSRRDVSFNVPAADTRRRESGILAPRGRDEIETLAECFGVLRSSSSSVATQTQTPSSPTDPGYVRHTASNWPRDLQRKTPPSTPLG